MGRWGPECGEYQSKVNVRVSDGERGFPSPAVPSRAGAGAARGRAQAWSGRTMGAGRGRVVQHLQHEPAAGAAPALPTARSWLGPSGGAPAAEFAPAACQGTGPTGEEMLRGTALGRLVLSGMLH